MAQGRANLPPKCFALCSFRLLLGIGSAIIRPVSRKSILGTCFDMCMLDEIRAKRDEIYAIAREHKAEKLWVFGSCARKEETPESDIDFLVKFGEGASLLSHVHMINSLSAFFGRKVDVVSDRGLSPYIGKYIRKEAVAI